MIKAAWLLGLVISAAPAAFAADDDLERLLEIGDEPFEPVTWPLRDPPFVHQKSLRLTPSSIGDGWVKNAQCHTRFAKMPSLQIVFNPDTIRNIEIVEAENVAGAWIEGASVQLEQVNENSRLCLRSDNRLLSKNPKTSQYELKVGPFYYRYLDGYFPMRLELDVEFPGSKLRLLDTDPDAGPGIWVQKQPGRVRFESLFQGKLWITFRFEIRNDHGSLPVRR